MTLFSLTVVLLLGAAVPAVAAPGDQGDDGEGASKTLITQLEEASRGFVEAKEALQRSQKRQRELSVKLQQLDAELGPRQAALDQVAREAYQAGRLGPMRALVAASSSGNFLDRTEALAAVAERQNDAIRGLRDNRDQHRRAKIAIDQAIRDQQKQVNAMAKRKAQAEAALKAANRGGDTAAEPTDGQGSARAEPGPSSSGGCSQEDPTTGGCLTARMLHALQQAQSDGFTRFVKCFREQNSGEHPKGRACDFAAQKTTFGGDATGGDKDYGTRLANYFINNSDELGVLYVIWYRRIWLPSSGWKSYSGANGDPSSDHTNHVHLSVR